MLNMTGIEEIVKYQQELLNHQRNQKLIQKETIKLLNALNKNITFMSDRLDEFALRTNIKLESNVCPTNTAQSLNNQINVNTLQELNTVINNEPFFNNNFYDTQLVNTQPVNNLIGGPSNNLTVTVPNPVTNQTISLNEDIKEYYILSDCNLEPLSVSQAPQIINQNGQLQLQQPQQLQQQHIQQPQHQPQPQQLVLIQQDNLNSPSIISPANLINTKSPVAAKTPKIKSSPNKSARSQRPAKLTDTTNMTGANTTATSDESIDDDMSMDESSEDEKETIQIRKKPKAIFSAVQSNTAKTKEYEESHNQQRLFNKYVRENVETRLGKEFLLLHEIQEIDHDVMESIKKDALEMYPPINIRPRRAWHLAKASLRCRRRSLRRQKEKQTATGGTTLATDNTSLTRLDPIPHTSVMDDSHVQTTVIRL